MGATLEQRFAMVAVIPELTADGIAPSHLRALYYIRDGIIRTACMGIQGDGSIRIWQTGVWIPIHDGTIRVSECYTTWARAKAALENAHVWNHSQQAG